MRLSEKSGSLPIGMLMLLCFLTAGTQASAATIEFRILIDGVHGSAHIISPGVHQLTVEGRVTGNEIVPGVWGGFIQTSFSAMDSANAVIWDESPGFVGAPSGKWDSSVNADLTQHFPGSLTNAKSDFLEDTAAMSPADWNEKFGAVGANVFSFISTGKFFWNGTTTTLSTQTSPNINLVATLKGSNIGAINPQVSFGDSTILQTPEPTAALLSIYAVGFQVLLMRQRRATAGVELVSQ
jgi:hypothetical protein